MTIKTTDLEDVLLITPKVFYDERGYFMETFNQKNFERFSDLTFVQDNESLSQKNVLRGLHFQKPPFAQAKLIRVVQGSIYDVAVDLRKDSPNYGKYYGHILSAENKHQLFIPIGFAHGFLSREDNTIINYKCSNFYQKEAEDSILWNDENLNIPWGVEHPIITEKDKHAQKFSKFDSPF
ncbi:dTDP-4-dehydrorhamnose 3,5-epimerase [Namhaeicola litoreus]|uniref:dTDP-4-dehydrorhamnose 3,5-epimerase n=1 Tax=Namhaeicola litoreus TaxID=1052145 RepID=A0ABW3Y5H1_9FLAO